MAPDSQLRLPVSVSGPVDIGRLIRELEAIDEALLQLSLRRSGEAAKLPKTSLLLDKLAADNGLNLLQADDRRRLLEFLKVIKHKAPRLHISFGADPPPAFMEKLVERLRQDIQPEVLVTVGLQPNLGAGCVIRTASHQFDFSLRQFFADKRQLLIDQLAGAEKPA